MAEFQEVHRQFDRMCWYYRRECKCPMGCPMNGVNISQCRKIAFERPKETEKIVMSWAAEHPEPDYPTWGDWLVEQGIIEIKTYQDITQAPTGVFYIGHRVNDPIPADTAEKLGLQPKEVER